MKVMDIKYRVYRYAPEQSVFWVDGKVYAPMYSQKAHDLGYLVITGKAKEAMDEIKRDIRKEYKKDRVCTFGFFGKGTNRYFYTSQLRANESELMEKLRIYKEWKRYIESRGGMMSSHEISEGSFTPGCKAKANTRVLEDIVDFDRPVKIYLV